MVQRRVPFKPIILKLTDTDNWSYRGEGKTGLVVTNNNGVALKLLKGKVEEDYLSFYVRNCQYVSICIAPIFGSFLCYGQIARLPSLLSSTVVASLHRRRSSQKDSCVDLKCPYGLLMQDACALPGHTNVMTLEIKPKAYLRTANAQQQSPLKCCRFCTQIERRYQAGAIPRVTGYCPRQFFSMKVSKLTDAISCLLDCPLSYLTVHHNGRRIFDEDNHNVEEMLAATGYRSRSELITVIVKMLLSKHPREKRSVLEVILEAQLINPLSIPELCEIYQMFQTHGLDIDLEIAAWLSGKSLLSDKFLDLLESVVKFSISVIAQDVSIMLSVTHGLDKSLSQIVSNGRVYSYKIAIVDVDMKSAKKLPVYLVQEKELTVVDGDSQTVT